MLSVRAFSVAMSHLAWQLSVPGCPPQLESGAQAWLKNIDSGQGEQKEESKRVGVGGSAASVHGSGPMFDR